MDKGYEKAAKPAKLANPKDKQSIGTRDVF